MDDATPLRSTDDRSDDERALDAQLTDQITTIGDALPAPDMPVAALATALDRGRVRHRRQAALGRVAAATAFLVLASGVTFAAWPRDRGGDVETTPFGTAPGTIGTIATVANAFGYEPGWHQLDPAPFEPRSGASVVWTGTEVVVFGGVFAETGGPGVPATGGVAYDLAAKSSRTVAPSPEGVGGQGVWTGREIVHIANGDDVPDTTLTNAAYDPTADAWRSVAPGPPTNGAGTGFSGSFWTGAEVLVPHRLAAYDPTDDSWRAMADPPAALAGVTLTAVWSGRELIFAGWQETAAAYDPAGDTWRMLPPAPRAIMGGPNMAGARYGRGVVFIDFEGSAKAFDTATNEWHELTVPPMSPIKCNTRAVTFGTAAVLDICSELLLLDEHNTFTVLDPLTDEQFGSSLVTADGTVVAWASNDDTLNDHRAPFTSFRLWAPPTELADQAGLSSS